MRAGDDEDHHHEVDDQEDLGRDGEQCEHDDDHEDVPDLDEEAEHVRHEPGEQLGGGAADGAEVQEEVGHQQQHQEHLQPIRGRVSVT